MVYEWEINVYSKNISPVGPLERGFLGWGGARMLGVWVSISSDSLPAGYSTICRTALAARHCYHHDTQKASSRGPRRGGFIKLRFVSWYTLYTTAQNISSSLDFPWRLTLPGESESNKATEGCKSHRVLVCVSECLTGWFLGLSWKNRLAL